MIFGEKNNIQSTEKIIENKVKEMSEKGQTVNEYDLISTVSALFILVNPPISILIAICAGIASAVKRNASLKEQKMPDDWLKKVSESEQVSKEGTQFLAKKLSKNGFVSVSDAITFLEMEKEIKENEHKENQKVKNLNNAGAVSLLEKANKEAPGMYNNAIDSFKRSWDVLSDVGETAMNLSNKGITAVKGLLKKD